MSQKELARRMRDRGWDKWSQGTVSAIETSQRPLRLAEALDICWILKIELQVLMFDENDAQIEMVVNQTLFAVDEIRDKVREGLEMQLWLAKTADALAPLSDNASRNTLDMIPRNPVQVAVEQFRVEVSHLRDRHQDLEPGTYLARLFDSWKDLEGPDDQHQEEA